MTPIGRNGYFIPIHPVPAEPAGAPALSAAVLKGPDPRMPTDPVTPAHLGGQRGARWLVGELRDHLWPWSAEGWNSRRGLQVAGVSLAFTVTLVWGLAAMGRLSGAAVIGWWFGWSLYEVLIRMSGRRYVKDGPWWQANYRRASWMDMLSYVGFKNLLIGAVLFLLLKGLGWLPA